MELELELEFAFGKIYVLELESLGFFLNSPALIWTLIVDNYSTCCLRVLDKGHIVNISALQTPLILSRGEHHNEPFYPSSQLRTLNSIKCLLNIFTFWISETITRSLWEPWGFQGKWGYLQQVRPQTYMILPQNDDQDFQFRKRVLAELILPHLPEIFVVHSNWSAPEQINMNFRIKFIC